MQIAALVAMVMGHSKSSTARVDCLSNPRVWDYDCCSRLTHWPENCSCVVQLAQLTSCAGSKAFLLMESLWRSLILDFAP